MQCGVVAVGLCVQINASFFDEDLDGIKTAMHAYMVQNIVASVVTGAEANLLFAVDRQSFYEAVDDRFELVSYKLGREQFELLRLDELK